MFYLYGYKLEVVIPEGRSQHSHRNHVLQFINQHYILIMMINPLCFMGTKGHVALDRNPWPGYNTLLLRLIPGDLYRACPHRQFHTLPSLLHSRAALSNSYPNACLPSREAVCNLFLQWFLVWHTISMISRVTHTPLSKQIYRLS